MNFIRERPGQLVPHHLVAFGQAPAMEEPIQFIQVADARNRRGEPLLDGLDGALGVGVLCCPGPGMELG